MSQEKVEIVRRLAAAFNDGSIEAMRPLLDPELVWHEDPSFPEAGVYCGRDEWDAYARQFIGEFSDIRYEQGRGDTVEAGDNLVVNILIHSRGTASGAEFRPLGLLGFHAPRRQGRPLLLVSRSRCGPRSRGAAGVGD
jgi:SnoaL-like domain